MRDKDNEEIWRSSLREYELPQPPPELRLKVMARIEKDRQRRGLIHRVGQFGAPFGFIAIIFSLSTWKPLQRLFELLGAWMLALLPNDLTGLIWYTAIWISIGLVLFMVAFLVISGLRFLEE